MQKVSRGTRTKRATRSRGLPAELEELKASRSKYAPVAPALKAYGLERLRSGEEDDAVAHLLGVSVRALQLWMAEAGLRRDEATAVTPPTALAEVADPHVLTLEAKDESSGADAHGQVAEAKKQLCATSGLSPVEIAAVLDLKRQHLSMQPAQLRAQLKRFKGWRLSIRAIGRVLKANGYDLVHTGSRPEGQEHPMRFEAPYRNALWQMDFVELRVGALRTPLLLVEDDFSRYVVGHELMPEPSSELVVEELKKDIHRHGRPDGIYTDRGGPFLAWREQSSLGRFLEEQLIDHHVSRPYKPQGRGKVEALAHTVRRELWDVEHFATLEEAREGLRRFFQHYNHHRAHLGIDGLTPADRFFGRWEEVKANVENAARRRETALVYGPSAPVVPYTEEVSATTGGVEVLRFVVVDGKLEIRMFGHRIVVGPVSS